MKKKQTLGKFFVLSLIIVFIIVLSKINKEFSEEKLIDTHVSINEVISELQFTVYSKEEWEDFFKKYKEKYLTREIVFDIVQKLGTGDVISFEVTGKKEAVVRTVRTATAIPSSMFSTVISKEFCITTQMWITAQA